MASDIFYLYAFPADDVDKLAEALAPILQVQWLPHNSSYIGDYCLARTTDRESFELQPNYLHPEKNWQEPEFQDYPTLLYINCPLNPEEIEAKLEQASQFGAVLIRKEVF